MFNKIMIFLCFYALITYPSAEQMDRASCSQLAILACQESAHCCKFVINCGCKYCAFPLTAACFFCVMCLCEPQAFLVEEVLGHMKFQNGNQFPSDDDIQDPLDRV